MNKKGLIFISNVQKANEHEWFADAIVNSGIDMDFVLFNSKDSELYRHLKSRGLRCNNYSLSSKFMIPVYVAFFWIKLLFRQYDVVHCHLLEASLIGIVAAKMAGVKKRIYTRHHSDFHHVYFPHAVKYDEMINSCATHIVAISEGVKEILIAKENVPASKVVLIPHGIPSQLLNKTIPVENIASVKEKYALNDHQPIVGIVSRFTIWKGVQYIIPAFKEFLVANPKAKLVLANSKGEYKNEIEKLLNELPETSYVLVEFENDMPALFSSFDMFIHAPVDKYCEAFGQVYLEAMCYGVPMICTISGVANSLVVNEHNALVVPYKDSKAISVAAQRLNNDPKLRSSLITNAKASVAEYTFETKMEKLMELYLH